MRKIYDFFIFIVKTFWFIFKNLFFLILTIL